MIVQSHSLNSAGIRDAGPAQASTVFVVDPDPATGKMVKDLLDGYKLTVQAYASGREFLAAYDGERAGCLVLEQRIFDISGLQIQQRMAQRNQRLPMVYVTSGLDVSTAVTLMRGGATHVLEKPLRSIELLGAIQEAVMIDEHQRRQESRKHSVQESIALLTRKERQLVGLLACAKSTTAIAAELSIGSRAVELRRRAVMDKLGLTSSLELMLFAVLACQECCHSLECAESQPGETGPRAADRSPHLGAVKSRIAVAKRINGVLPASHAAANNRPVLRSLVRSLPNTHCLADACRTR